MEKENKKNAEYDKIEKSLNELTEIVKKNQEDIGYIKRFVLWSQIWSVIKIVLIFVPIILGFIYLPSFLKNWIDESYRLNPENSGDYIFNKLME